jgi:hypothetical protein
MTDLVSAFIKTAQSFFVQIRNLEASYSEEMSEVAHAHLAYLNTTGPVATRLKQVFPLLYIFNCCMYCAQDHLCGLVARLPGCTHTGPGFDSWRCQIF